jgi:hypothetical protein
MSDDPLTHEDALKVMAYMKEHDRLSRLSNDDLAHVFLENAPLFTVFADICELVAERLSPGIIIRMSEEGG